jgi:hypothetical protein
MRPLTNFSQPVSTKAEVAPEWSLAWPGLYVSTIDPGRSIQIDTTGPRKCVFQPSAEAG